MQEIIGEGDKEYINGFQISAWMESDGMFKIEYFYKGIKKHEVVYKHNGASGLSYFKILDIAEKNAPNISELRKKIIDEL